MAANMKKAELDVEPHWITKEKLDGKAFTSTGHSLGNRTEIVFKVARWYLTPGSRQPMIRQGPNDFELRDTKVRYPTPNGVWIISYEAGYPIGRFENKPHE